ncbi:MAG TPA: hypothetical protein VFQ36_22675 [Ktedonobacteraceae bacterium]|nr:hypothetical protein [Ktedonobacteraceae bacterium]
MRNTKFIFVEGIMGSGKSTTAWFLVEYLQKSDTAAQFMSEGGYLRVALDLPHPNGVWLDVTVEEYIELSLRKWHTFAREAQQSTTVTACDGLLFHGNMTDLMLMNAPIEMLHSYVAQVIEIVSDLNPVIIYFSHPDITRALRQICKARGSEWEAYQVNWKVLSPYGAQRSLHGFDGLVQLYQSYYALCNDIFTQLTLPKLAIRNEGDWTRYYEEILAFLQPLL